MESHIDRDTGQAGRDRGGRQEALHSEISQAGRGSCGRHNIPCGRR